jgi:hypothetical protein
MGDLTNFTPRLDYELHHLSYSQLWLFSSCPKRWFLERVEKLRMVPQWALVTGSSIHKGLETNNLEIASGQKGLMPGEIVESAIAEMEGFEGVEEMEKNGVSVPLDKAKDRFAKEATAPVTQYKHEMEPDLLQEGEITGVEEEVNFEIGGVPFVGYLDLVLEGAGLFFDYKFVSRKKSDHAIRYDAQSRLYQLAKPDCSASLIQLIRGSKRCEEGKIPNLDRATNGITAWAETQVSAIKVALKTGVFPRCQPGSWQCSKQTCSFFRNCYPATKE